MPPFAIAATNHSAYFTQPLGDLPLGAKIKYGVIYDHPMVWAKKDKDHLAYPENTTTFMMDKIEKVMPSDVKEPQNSTGGYRSTHGNNRYIHTNKRQWLNKAGLNWYEPQHPADAPPTDANTDLNCNGYDNFPGFLSCFTDKELAICKPTTLTVNKNPGDGAGQDTFTDKFFLPSLAEVGTVNPNQTTPAEGTKLAGFSDDSSRMTTLTAEALANSGAAGADCSAWHLRSPFGTVASDNYSAIMIYLAGGCHSLSMFHSNIGLRVACNLDSDALVTGGPDEDGCYTLV